MKQSKSVRKTAAKIVPPNRPRRRRLEAPLDKPMSDTRAPEPRSPSERRSLVSHLSEIDPTTKTGAVLDDCCYAVVHCPDTGGKVVDFDPTRPPPHVVRVTTSDVPRLKLMLELVKVPLQVEFKELSPERLSTIAEVVAEFLLEADVTPPGFPCSLAKEVLDRLDGLKLPR